MAPFTPDQVIDMKLWLLISAAFLSGMLIGNVAWELFESWPYWVLVPLLSGGTGVAIGYVGVRWGLVK